MKALNGKSLIEKAHFPKHPKWKITMICVNFIFNKELVISLFCFFFWFHQPYFILTKASIRPVIRQHVTKPLCLKTGLKRIFCLKMTFTAQQMSNYTILLSWLESENPNTDWNEIPEIDFERVADSPKTHFLFRCGECKENMPTRAQFFSLIHWFIDPDLIGAQKLLTLSSLWNASLFHIFCFSYSTCFQWKKRVDWLHWFQIPRVEVFHRQSIDTSVAILKAQKMVICVWLSIS